MILAVDIGNSAIKFGLFEGETLTSKFSIPTNRSATADEMRSAVDGRFGAPVESSIVCSVVPELESEMRSFLRSLTSTEPIFVDNSSEFRLQIDYEPLNSLGTDRLVAAFAAVEKYGAPTIVCSLGTATTIDVVNAEREFLGGLIAPGMDAMAEALHLKAPRLPRVEATKPTSLFGSTTPDSIRSGIFNGYVAMIGGLIDQFGKQSGEAKVVATGGNAELVARELESVDIVDADLILNGLRALSGQ